ncbi:RtcB family protein [Natrinema marinum]|uniref:RtcB family protein n=1 Tax=Natrinema marinum TaxID=2961598 RepID=UPI0020C8AA64|nr:RtcB family protein [Natrinema marinum]
MTFEIDGEQTTAVVLGPRTAFDESFVEQVQEVVDHEAFRNPVRIMPDGHPGAGSVVGFTMALGDRICPNTVGVDIGCGMTAIRLDDDTGRWLTDSRGDEARMHDLDEDVRQAIPMGRSTFGDADHPPQTYHLVDDFPWDRCEAKRESLNEHWNGEPIASPPYGKEYFLALCDRLEYSPKRAIDSLGTLGGGNHFVEIARSERTGAYWVIVHSGSRGIGLSIARYWQERATEHCDDRADEIRDRLAPIDDRYYTFDLESVSDRELLDWVQGGMGEDWKVMDAVVADYRETEPDRIDETKTRLNEIARYASENGGGDELDYLEGSARHGYLRDMIFAQTYAAESRRLMTRAVADVLDADIEETIVSTHNYIDFEDLVIRKGATRVHDGERGVIPFNMRDGSIVVRGTGNDRWNRSAPHGAGRRGSRTWAFEEFTLAEFSAEMADVFSTSVTEETIDEAPMAYKDRDVIRERIGETATIEDTLVPVHNIKAEE